jgi:hypothetical protein
MPAFRAHVKRMRRTDESSSPALAWRRVAEGNCVAARRGGEQPEAKLSSQTGQQRPVNPIRPESVASLRNSGEARFQDLIPKGTQHVMLRGYGSGGWGEKAVKVRQINVEIPSCADERRGEVRALIVAMTRVTHRLESRMREIRPYGSEGGVINAASAGKGAEGRSGQAQASRIQWPRWGK